MSDDYQKFDINELQGKMREVTNPIYVPNPEEMQLDQIPTLQKMLTDLHFKMIEAEAQVEVLKSQIIAVNCAINAVARIQNKKHPKLDQPEN